MQMETSLRGRLTLVLWAAAAALFLLGPGSGTAISAASATPAPLAPASSFTPSTTVTRLRCEYAVNPLGIDAARPRLSWALESSRRGTRQTA